MNGKNSYVEQEQKNELHQHVNVEGFEQRLSKLKAERREFAAWMNARRRNEAMLKIVRIPGHLMMEQHMNEIALNLAKAKQHNCRNIWKYTIDRLIWHLQQDRNIPWDSKFIPNYPDILRHCMDAGLLIDAGENNLPPFPDCLVNPWLRRGKRRSEWERFGIRSAEDLRKTYSTIKRNCDAIDHTFYPDCYIRGPLLDPTAHSPFFHSLLQDDKMHIPVEAQSWCRLWLHFHPIPAPTSDSANPRQQ